MNLYRRSTILLAVCVVALLAGCGELGDRKDGFRLRGSLLDAETGEPVSRETFYLHFFCDEIGFQRTLDPANDSAYSVRLPRATVRVRAYDRTKVYELFEKTIQIEGGAREFDIPLAGTGYIRLFGKVIELSTGKTVRPGADGGHGPLLYFHAEGTSFRAGPEWLEADGTYSIMVPRAKVSVSAVDTAMRPRVPQIDLTGKDGPEHEFDIELE